VAKRPEENNSASVHGQILFAVGVLLALYVAWQVREVLLLLYVSALFAVVLTPVVRGIMQLHIGKWHPGRGTAVALLLLWSMLAIGGFFLLAMPPAWRDLLAFLYEAPSRAPGILDRLRNLPLAENLDVGALTTQVTQAASATVGYLFSSLPGWAAALGEVLTGLVLTIYFMLEGEHAYEWFLSLVPVERRERLNETLLRAEVRMGKWLLGQGALMLILGVSSTIVFGLMGIKYFYLLGALMGLANIVPVAGAVVTVALSALVAGIDSWEKMVGVLVFYGIYAQIENGYLLPRIMKTRVDLAGLAVLVALLVGAALAGVAGAIVSVPTAVLVAVLMDEYVVQHDGDTGA
jgi:predicted PurR-regulated permease PerM